MSDPTLPAQPTPPRPTEPAVPTSPDPRVWMVRVAKVVVVFIYVVVIVNLVLLTLAFVLELFGASTDAAFTRWVYRNVDRAMDPFRGMFPSHAVNDQSVLDVSLLFAMIVYAIAGIALHTLVTWLTGKLTALRRQEQAAARRGAVPDAATAAGRRYP